jgi:threonine dehydratase
LQPTSSYKIRGALNAVARLSEGATPPSSLVTASAGNHGRALAYAAALARTPLTVYVPETAPSVKLDALRRSGARLVTCPDYESAERAAKKASATGAGTYISPYSHPDVIAGAGTVALEIAQDVEDLGCIVAAVGGGGLISGVAIAAPPAVKTIGVEAEASCPFARSLAAGHIVQIEVQPTLADGLAGNLDSDTITFDLVRRHVDGLAAVTENEIRSAIAGLVAEEQLIVEGAGAAAVAAVLTGKVKVRGQRCAIVLSGANIDARTLCAIIETESRPR